MTESDPFSYGVWDNTTKNLLGEFAEREHAEKFLNEIKPHGRYGPEGHDLVVLELDEHYRIIG